MVEIGLFGVYIYIYTCMYIYIYICEFYRGVLDVGDPAPPRNRSYCISKG